MIMKSVHRWYCPACRKEDMTYEPQPQATLSRFHPCPRMGGLTVPMLPAGTKAKIEAHEREDYIGTDRVQLDANGRPVMSVVTTRDNGQDTTVYAPTATGGVR